MTDVFFARIENAKKVASSIKELIDSGFMVVDDEGSEIKDIKITNDSAGNLETVVANYKDGSFNLILFEADKEYDHGMHTPIKEFNAQFDSWKVYHPLMVKSLSSYLDFSKRKGKT